MSLNFNTLAPISATVLSIGGLIFQMGKHSEKLDILNTTVFAQEKKVNDNYKYINDMKLFITRTDDRLDKINDIGKKIPNILWPVAKAANNANINKFL